jgi:hypothetical protein
MDRLRGQGHKIYAIPRPVSPQPQEGPKHKAQEKWKDQNRNEIRCSLHGADDRADVNQ